MATSTREKPQSGKRKRPLWTCPRCGKPFVTRNLWHSCSRVPLSAHFRGKPVLRRLFDQFVAAVREADPARVVPNQTCICLVARVRFTGTWVRRDHLRCSFALRRAVRLRRFVKVEEVAPHWFAHFFELRDPGQLDTRLKALLRESYAVGTQEALPERAGRARPRRS